MIEEKIVLYDSDEAATYKTGIVGWVASTGQYWAKDEHMARWSGCTHMKCECGKIFPKGRLHCDSCQAKLDTEKYYALPLIDWDETTPVCEWHDDRYFWDKESVLEYMYDLLEDAKKHNCEPEFQLVICEPQYLHRLDSDNWVDDLAEDGELPDAVMEAIDVFNEILKNQGPSCWYAGKHRIDVDALWKELKEDLAKENATEESK
jgi:hypothetical protein